MVFVRAIDWAYFLHSNQSTKKSYNDPSFHSFYAVLILVIFYFAYVIEIKNLMQFLVACQWRWFKYTTTLLYRNLHLPN